MGKDKLEGHIKKHIEHYGSPVDEELFWLSVKARLKKKKRRRFLWVFGLGALTIGIVGILLINGWLENSSSTINHISQNQKSSIHSNTSTAISANPTIEMNEDNSDSKLLEIESDRNPIVNDVNSGFTKSIRNEIEVEQSTKISPLQDNNVSSKIKIEAPRRHNEATNEVDMDSYVQRDSKFKSNVQLDKQNRILISITPLMDEFVSVIFERTPLQLSRNPIPYPVKRIKRRNNDVSPFASSLGMHFNYGFVSRNLSSDMSSMVDYIETRKDLEIPLDVFGGGLDYRIMLSDKLYLSTGLNYNQINERFDHTVNTGSMITVEDRLLRINYFLDGSIENVYGEGPAIYREITRKKIFNKYRSIDLPISIGYSSAIKKLYWTVDGGVSINIWSKASGEIIGANGNFLRLDANENYKGWTGFSMIASAGLGYQIKNDFSIEFRPGIKYQFSSISAKESGFTQKYLNSNLAVAIRYQM